MFQFLNTAFLGVLAAVGLPVLIHFIARRKAVRIFFSSIRFLKHVEMQRARFFRVKQILLLVARALAVAFIVIAFSRPVVRSGQGGHPGAAALVVDCSASMDRDALFDKARGRLKSYLSTLHPDDRIILFRPGFSDAAEPLNQDAVEAVLKKSETAGYGDCALALKRAEEWLLRNPVANPEIVLVSDMQAAGFRSRAEPWSNKTALQRLWIFPVRGETENAGIVNGGIENKIFEPGARLTVEVELRNYGERPVDELLVGVYLNGTGVSQKTVTLGPGERRRIAFMVNPEHAGWNWGEVRIDGDAFDLDNGRYFAFRVPETIPVLLVGKSRQDLLPIVAALTPEKGRRGIFDVEQASTKEPWADRLGDRGVLVLADVPGLSDSDAEKLDVFFERGGGLFLIFGKDALPESNAYRPVTERFGVAFGSAMGRGGALSMGMVDFSHPIFDGVFEKGKENIHSPRFFRTVPVSGKTLRTVMALNNGQPLLSEARSTRNSLIVFSSGLDEAWSDMAVSTVFAPMMVRSVLYLAGPKTGEKTGCTIGESIRVAVRNDSLKSEWTVVTPSGESLRLLPEIRGREVHLSFEGAESPGIYKFYRNGVLIDVRAVNVDPLESDFRTVSEKQLKALFPDRRVQIISEDQRIEPAVQEGRTGKELWKPILLAALGLLIFESILADGWKEK